MNWIEKVTARVLSHKSSARQDRRAKRVRTFEQLENRQLFAIAPLAPLGAKSTLLIPTGETPVHFFLDSRSTPNNDELGYFFVDGPDGRITRRVDNDPESPPLLHANGTPQYVRPGDADYTRVALSSNNSEVVFASGEVPNFSRADKILDVLGDRTIAFYIIRNGTSDTWRTTSGSARPSAWFSIGKVNSDGYEHFQATKFGDSFYRRGLLQYKVEDSNIAAAKHNRPGHDVDLDDMVFSVNIVPYATSDDFSVFNSGPNLDGTPQRLRMSSPGDQANQGLGLLWNDYLPSNPAVKPTVTAISLDDGESWINVVNPVNRQTKVTVTDPLLRGTLTVFATGGIDFVPDAADTWWSSTPINSDPDPDPIEFMYRISDGIDSAEAYITITHGFYQRGSGVDNLHAGKKMVLLAGGGSSGPFDEGRKKFFQEGSNGQDILLIAQGTEQREFVNDVFDYYADGRARSVTSLNITTREQANDPRLARYVDGADLIWLGGGAQSIYQATWQGTLLFAALQRAAEANVAIGGTSAGMAILGEAAYVDRPWDSVKSRFATEKPLDARVNVVRQGTQLPFSGLSSGKDAPLSDFVTDTHFSSRDRMGRLVAFAAKSNTRGLGVDESTAVLIERVNGAWQWSVYGEGSAYIVTPAPRSAVTYSDHLRLSTGAQLVYKLNVGVHPLSTVLSGPSSYRVWVSRGTVYTTDNGGGLY